MLFARITFVVCDTFLAYALLGPVHHPCSASCVLFAPVNSAARAAAGSDSVGVAAAAAVPAGQRQSGREAPVERDARPRPHAAADGEVPRRRGPTTAAPLQQRRKQADRFRRQRAGQVFPNQRVYGSLPRLGDAYCLGDAYNMCLRG
jgi:hypothetical protein